MHPCQLSPAVSLRLGVSFALPRLLVSGIVPVVTENEISLILRLDEGHLGNVFEIGTGHGEQGCGNDLDGSMLMPPVGFGRVFGLFDVVLLVAFALTELVSAYLKLAPLQLLFSFCRLMFRRAYGDHWKRRCYVAQAPFQLC
jgi:hypothetical protein